MRMMSWRKLLTCVVMIMAVFTGCDFPGGNDNFFGSETEEVIAGSSSVKKEQGKERGIVGKLVEDVVVSALSNNDADSDQLWSALVVQGVRQSSPVFKVVDVRFPADLVIEPLVELNAGEVVVECTACPEAPENLLIERDSAEKMLMIRARNDEDRTRFVSANRTPVIRLRLKTLPTEIRLSGSARGKIAGRLVSDELKVIVREGAQLAIDAAVFKRLEIQVTGTGSVVLGEDVVVRNLYISAHQMAEVAAHGLFRTVQVFAAHSAQVLVVNPRNVSVTTIDSSRVRYSSAAGCAVYRAAKALIELDDCALGEHTKMAPWVVRAGAYVMPIRP